MNKVTFLSVILLGIIPLMQVYADDGFSIPSWIKQIASFWAQDKISDKEFGEAITYLIENEIIKVELVESLRDEISQLKQENSSQTNEHSKIELEESMKIKSD